jgi:lysophospholipase L1-like esterase
MGGSGGTDRPLDLAARRHRRFTLGRLFNASLDGPQQAKGFASRIARRAGFDLPLPAIDDPGIPNALELLDPGPPPVIVPTPGISRGRIDPLRQPRNLAVPGARVADTLEARPLLPPRTMTDLVLGFPGLLRGISRSQVEWAEALRPTTIIVWIGSNDVLTSVLRGDPSRMTPPAEFRASYREMIDRLHATGARLVITNLPDVTVVPFLIPAEKVAEALGRPLSEIGPRLGIARGDWVTPRAAVPLAEILRGRRLGPLPGETVLDAGEAALVRRAIDDHNAFIADLARENGAVLVDIHALLERVRRDGLPVGRRRLTVDYLGGFFSLDGIHPSITGHAAIANEFLAAMNARLDPPLRPLALDRIAASDPLVISTRRRPPSALGMIGPETVANLLGMSDLP